MYYDLVQLYRQLKLSKLRVWNGSREIFFEKGYELFAKKTLCLDPFPLPPNTTEIFMLISFLPF